MYFMSTTPFDFRTGFCAFHERVGAGCRFSTSYAEDFCRFVKQWYTCHAVHHQRLLILGALLCETLRAQAPPARKWVKFQVPFEKAFTIDVPQGWAAKGGMFRLGYSDIRPMLDLRSPDGKVEIRSGDVAVPTYAMPTPSHREGEIGDLGAQAVTVFANYRPGKEYARLYALAHFRTECRSLTPQDADQAAPVKEQTAGANSLGGAVAYR
jgi:hypothetical protein